jgi:hypothetical protein
MMNPASQIGVYKRSPQINDAKEETGFLWAK